VISGNLQNDIHLFGSSATGNTISGVFVGVDATGMMELGNGHDGILMEDGADNNTICAPATGGVNVISGKPGNGVDWTNVKNEKISASYIGLAKDGSTIVANGLNGVLLSNGAKNNQIGTDTWLAPGVSNVISGNKENGINIDGSAGDCTQNNIRWNYIGIALDGSTPKPNKQDGVFIDSASWNKIGEGPNSGNVISANLQNGVEIANPGASNNLVSGNKIGTGKDGISALDDNGKPVDGNKHDGVAIWAADNNVSRCVISGNWWNGIRVAGSDAVGNRVIACLIGVQGGGLTPLGNLRNGILIGSGAHGNTVGSDFPEDGNVISGNVQNGVRIKDADENSIFCNYIGLGTDGSTPVPNDNGVLLEGSACSNIIGEPTNGMMNEPSNVISGNTNNGILLDGANVNGTRICSNYIGTSADGLSKKPNLLGVGINGGSYNYVGDGNTGDGNLISGNLWSGLEIDGDENRAAGNWIGTDSTGLALLGNTFCGIVIQGSHNYIGMYSGTPSTSTDDPDPWRNVISGNTSDGVYVVGAGENQLLDNYIGTDKTGTNQIANGGAGVHSFGSSDNTIGLPQAVGGSNIISGNDGGGIRIEGDGSGDNKIKGNYVGLKKNGAKLPNTGDGVFLGLGSDGAIVGGTDADARNVISCNTKNGVNVSSANCVITNNIIGLDPGGNNPNDFKNTLLWLDGNIANNQTVPNQHN
jgi:hypothetical protein